jgi:hypothetical protein
VFQKIMLTLPVSRFRFAFRATFSFHLNDWSGSMLRGAFGHALKRASCMTRQRECGECPLYQTCPYPAIFAPPPREETLHRFNKPPVPYLFEPESWGAKEIQTGDAFIFSMVLMGRAIGELPLIVFALKQAFRRGMGKDKTGKAELECVEFLPPFAAPEIVYREGDKRVASDARMNLTVPDFNPVESLSLEFISPLRLQENGKRIPAEHLTPHAFLMTLVRRVSMIGEIYGGSDLDWNFHELTEISKTIEDEKELRCQDWTRYSSRQKTAMTLGGLTGIWKMRGNLTPFLPAIYAGLWTHAGKETSFGLGHYLWSDMNRVCKHTAFDDAENGVSEDSSALDAEVTECPSQLIESTMEKEVARKNSRPDF